MNLFKIINKLLFPPRCIFCDRLVDFRKEYHICDKCGALAEKPQRPYCTICMRETLGGFGNDLCANCRTNPPHYQRLRAPYVYDKYTRSCVLRLKFHGRTDHARTMGKQMADLIKDDCRGDMIIPVPISKKRFHERGYNQSALFSKEMSRLLNIPMRTDLLFKIKDTAPQSSMKFKERVENVKGAYKTADSDDIKSKHIILTDDVATSRSTIDECARILKRAGAKSVECVTFGVVKGDYYQ